MNRLLSWTIQKLNIHKYFFQSTILFKFISNATIYLTPKMFISIINTESCFFLLL
uniref:Uncharacterized protein n=1 Tax=Anguilla anguilla TaxID=7936 RepID=A0A0E9W322_ANGAN